MEAIRSLISLLLINFLSIKIDFWYSSLGIFELYTGIGVERTPFSLMDEAKAGVTNTILCSN
ncbi:CLUMA_CG010381, isoform A [Clunio marinus]|uniref:CLUMA_CG010381, isoform A n=1 Tax=Clunio marinus TaxID=568069 RepID=A0A1J1I9F3_9DIPT|nr:CLUMA_CG010381, isoform A [Clunio marinus]